MFVCANLSVGKVEETEVRGILCVTAIEGGRERERGQRGVAFYHPFPFLVLFLQGRSYLYIVKTKYSMHLT